MPRRLLFDQFHLNVYVSRGLPPTATAAVRRALAGADFRLTVRRAVAAVVRTRSVLRHTTWTVTR
jgi:hypothetical protein